MNADADDPRLLSLASAIADGSTVDWKEIAQQLADPEKLPLVDELRSLERFKTVNDMLPSRWGPFLITAELGRGTFGRVYHAVDPDLQLEIALKVIPTHVTDASSEEPHGLKEARLLAKISHPNVVRVFRVERIAGDIGIAMELIRGRALNQVVRASGPMSAHEATVIGIDLCRAMAAVHGAGMIHGDIKAHNVMRENGGRTILMDFGAGRMLHREVPPDGDFAGTPVYLAPEVFAGADRTKASDIYSLGILLYYLVSARYPVEGVTASEIARQHRHGATTRRPLRDARPDLPDAFVRVVEQALAGNPEARFQSAGALEDALANAMKSSHDARDRAVNRRKLALVAAGVAVILAFGGYRLYQPAVPQPAETALQPAVSQAPAAAPYRIEAALYVERGGVESRAQQATRVAPGDKLSLHVRTSVPAHVYVVNEDEQGEQYLLFPLAGQAVTNPLPPGRVHRLPGMQDGQQLSWQVTSAGGREHFIIFASPTPLSSFEKMFATLPQPVRDNPIQSVRLSQEAVGVLRGVGGISSTSVQRSAPVGLARDFPTPLVNGEETVRGVWIRQVTLDNPVP